MVNGKIASQVKMCPIGHIIMPIDIICKEIDYAYAEPSPKLGPSFPSIKHLQTVDVKKSP